MVIDYTANGCQQLRVPDVAPEWVGSPRQLLWSRRKSVWLSRGPAALARAAFRRLVHHCGARLDRRCGHLWRTFSIALGPSYATSTS